jgi:hypothetical protein
MTGSAIRNGLAGEPEGIENDDPLEDWTERVIQFVKTLPGE